MSGFMEESRDLGAEKEETGTLSTQVPWGDCMILYSLTKLTGFRNNRSAGVGKDN